MTFLIALALAVSPVDAATLAPAAPASVGASAGEREDVRAALERLEASSAAERNGAERWLGAHLAAADFPIVAETAKQRGLEARTRLTRALGSDDRHFELA